MNQSVFLLCCTVVATGTWVPSLGGAEREQEGKLAPFLGKPHKEMQQLFPNERFPNIVVTTEGTVLAALGSSGVRVRRSEDGGQTWGEVITIAEPGFPGGGITVDESCGDILAFVEDKHPPAPLTVYRSQDDGRSWKAEAIEIEPDSRGNLPSMHMNEHGITLRHGKHKGRLIRPSRYYGERNSREEWPNHYTNAIYSDDGGKSWKTSDPFPRKWYWGSSRGRAFRWAALLQLASPLAGATSKYAPAKCG